MASWFWASRDTNLGTGDNGMNDGGALIEPKRKYRWQLLIGGIPTWTIKKVDKPSFTVTTAEHVYINHKFYYPGRVEYNEIGFTIVDAANPDAAESLRQMLMASGYRYPFDSVSATNTITKNAAVTSLGRVDIQMITAAGIGGMNYGDIGGFHDGAKIQEQWTLHNAFVTSMEFGDLDYTSDDLSEINIKMRYDFALLNRPDAGAGLGSAIQSVPPDNAEVAWDAGNFGDDPERLD